MFARKARLGSTPLARPSCILVVALATVLGSWASSALGADPSPGASAVGPTGVGPQPLGELPSPPKLELPRAAPADLEAVAALLERLHASDAGVRESAVREILEIGPQLVPAIHERLSSLAEKADRDAMKQLLRELRSRARASERSRMKSEGTRGKVRTPDYLEIATGELAEPKSPAWKELVEVLGMSRMLTQIGTTEATRELIGIYVRFGEFLRIDTQLELEKLGDKAVAALIETRRHPAPKIANWASRQLDALGKAIPSEAVQTGDFEALGDILLAYGRTRDPDAARIVISFANIERAQVRLAARQAVVLMGDVANWQLRDTYEDTIGKKPPRDWDWKRTARELFSEYDRQRLARVYDLFDDGIADFRAGKLDEMRQAFDRVLARSPLFDRRAEMAPGYLAYARATADVDRDAALLALRRAARLTADDAARKPVTSLLLTLEGEALLDEGTADQTFFRRALELDPANGRARDALARIERGEMKPRSAALRYAGAGAIGAAALIALGFIAFRRRGASSPSPADGSQTLDPPTGQPTSSRAGEDDRSDGTSAGDLPAPTLIRAESANDADDPKPASSEPAEATAPACQPTETSAETHAAPRVDGDGPAPTTDGVALSHDAPLQSQSESNASAGEEDGASKPNSTDGAGSH
ncbi:MAG: hypothetical protein OZ921_04305 [Sorangiineae bacterium]|nr:hypothetical protein [Sorangiineae bacterium]